MADSILNTSATLQCPHAGSVSIVTTNSKVLLGGSPAVVVNDTFTIAGCPFVVGPKPQPCILAQWLVPAKRVKVNGQFVLTMSSSGICKSAEQIPQGPPIVVQTQAKVTAI